MPDWICFFCIVLFLYVTAWPYFLQSICTENASLLTILLSIKGMFFIGWTKFWETTILVWSLFFILNKIYSTALHQRNMNKNMYLSLYWKNLKCLNLSRNKMTYIGYEMFLLPFVCLDIWESIFALYIYHIYIPYFILDNVPSE